MRQIPGSFFHAFFATVFVVFAVSALVTGVACDGFVSVAYADDIADEFELSYMYVDKSELEKGDKQYVVVSLAQTVPDMSEVELVYRDDAGNEDVMPLKRVVGEAMLFELQSTDMMVGTYHVAGLRYVVNGVERSVEFDAYDIAADFSVSDSSNGKSVEENNQEAGVIELDDGDIESGEASSTLAQGIGEAEGQVPSAASRSDRSGGDLVVVLDPGHGGRDSGAVGYGLQEADLTLKIAKYAKAELEKYAGVKVYMTRSSDKDLCTGGYDEHKDLQARVDYAIDHNADILVSIHLNSYNGAAYGAEVYYPNTSGDSHGTSAEGKKAAQEIQDELVALGLYDRGITTTNEEYYVIRNSKYAGFPGIIVEHAFIDNSYDVSRFLKSESGLKKLGVADAKGIVQAYGLKKDTWLKPTLNSVTASSPGYKVSWKSVPGASGYAVYRKDPGGSWGMIDTTTDCGYVDRSLLESGKTYGYTVRAYRGSEQEAIANKYDSKYWTSFDSSGVQVVVTPVPSVSKLSTAASGIKIEWEKVPGASGYAVYRKTDGKDWAMVGTSTGESYSDKNGLNDGVTYRYTLRAYRGAASTALSNKYDARYWSSFNADGESSAYHPCPVLIEVRASGDGRKVSWKASADADGYAVYRRRVGGSWAMIADTVSTSYIDEDALVAGAAYDYTVRAYAGDRESAFSHKYESAYWSHFDTAGLRASYLEIPKLNASATASSGIKVSWEKAAGASGYAVFRKGADGNWGMIGTTTSTAYTDKSGLKNGSAYAYTVRSYRGSLSTAKAHKYSAQYWSSFSAKGVPAAFLQAPKLSKEKAAADGAWISWSPVPEVTGYAVYRKSSTSGWAMIATTDTTSFTETAKLVDGAAYSYTVRAYSGDTSAAVEHKYDSFYWSHFDGTGLKTVHLATPVLNQVEQTSEGNKLSWGEVPAASGYAVYRRLPGADWAMFDTTTSTSYMDSSAGDYEYTVRAHIGSIAEAKKHKYSSCYWSGYDANGVRPVGFDPLGSLARFIASFAA